MSECIQAGWVSQMRSNTWQFPWIPPEKKPVRLPNANGVAWQANTRVTEFIQASFRYHDEGRSKGGYEIFSDIDVSQFTLFLLNKIVFYKY